MNILLTGPPRCGKTTLVESVVAGVRNDLRLAGFVTREVRERGDRTGFDIITMDGRRAPLARKDRDTGPRVGAYRVDVASLDSVAVPSMSDPAADAFVVDEIGMMELASRAFRERVEDLLEDDRPLVATIRWRPQPFCNAVKARDDVELIEVDHGNRDALVDELVHRLLTHRRQP